MYSDDVSIHKCSDIAELTTDDDPDDPDYNLLGEVDDPEDLDADDLRNDRTTEIPGQSFRLF